MKVVSVTQTRPAKQKKTSHSTFRGKIKLKKYSREEYDTMSLAQCQQLYELQKKIELINGKKNPESIRALEARVAVLEAKTENSSDGAYLQMLSPLLVIDIIQPSIERETVPDRAMQTFDGYGH